MGNAIELKGVGIEFPINRKSKMRARDFVIHGRRARSSERFWALRNVDLSIAQGETVGLIGANGCGKSTLLKIIAGVLLPDEGTVEVNGAVAPLIGLGAGFSPDLSARENVYMNATILGLTREQVDACFNDIIEFAEVGRFLDTPLKHFSSGMKARLGFSIVTRLDHPILLIDEVLAVGDRRFRQKSYAAMERMIAGGRTVVLVSHNDNDIQRFCERAVYLKDGQVVTQGPTEDVLERYRADVEGREPKQERAPQQADPSDPAPPPAVGE